MAPDTPTGSPPKACRSPSYSCSFTSASVVPWPTAASIISPIRLTGPTVNSRSPTIRPTRPFSKSLTYLPQRDVTSSNVEVFLFTIFDLRIYTGPLTHGRKYSKEELWDNYTYFIRQIAPVAEEAGVRIGIHPDDPPVPELGGIPRHIFGTFDGYVRALEIANSPNIGVCLCCGTWAEGGDQMGKNVYEAVRAFANMGKLWKIHFRNVTSPIPDFVETYIDNGYTDMSKLMKTLVEVDFRGNLIADHVPPMTGGRQLSWSYSMGYIRALYDFAQKGKSA